MTNAAMPERSHARSLVFFVLCAASAWPLFSAPYLPIQDLPQHLAAIRVLHSWDDPAFDFARHFELQLGRTQYLLYYAAAHLLSYVMPLEQANLWLIAAAVFATPYALRTLLRALGRDERLALLSLPLAYNAHLILGFVNFVWAIVLMLYGLALAVRQRRAPNGARALGLSLVLLACFYAHVVPFALLGLGVVLVSVGLDWRGSVRRLLPTLPAALASLLWLWRSPAGQATLSAASARAEQRKPVFEPSERLWAELPSWLTDVLHGDTDRELLTWFLRLFALTALLGLLTTIARAVQRKPAAEDVLSRRLTLLLVPLPILAFAAYFIAPTGYDWIWPIAQRFPLLALLLAVAVVPAPPRHVTSALLAGVVVIFALTTREVTRAFVAFDRDEVSDFDQALAHIPERSRVAGLIFSRGSRHVKFSPFIHYVAYYQARRGGVVMFTFADFPQSPFRFRDDDRPPPVGPRWEWMPERVRAKDLAFYDYVLVRGGPGALARDKKLFTPLYRGKTWSVFRKQR